ncbi:AraC family transcriptional regulator [Xanthobacteraceae bacterium Astr-EGSB]|uniref:AraC family transcriptional regulator n=1 Tax=Astrobacterium formosum TaxID=3069710 RepID=UPI0027AE9AB1|nr:AraC family transcriptional regulator [Xanthobacteraceae bacterium Astr-EGSB]
MTFDQSTAHSMSGAFAAVRVMHCRDAMRWHTHAGPVFVRIDRGERTLATTETIISLREGDGAVIPAFQAHAFAAAPAPGCSYRAVRIVDDARRPMPAGPVRDPAWRTAFDHAFAAIEAGSAPADPAVAALVNLTVALLPHPWKPPAEPGAVRRVRRLVEADLGNDFRLPALARAAGMSTFHLHRLYRRLWGVTPAQHGLETRLRVAREALLGGASVAAAAAASGFADQSHLTRAFRRFMGVPPERWRRQVSASATPVRSSRA